MFLRDHLVKIASRFWKSQRKAAANLDLSFPAWNAIVHGKADPRLRTLINMGERLGFQVVLSSPTESVALRIALPKRTGTKAVIEIVPAESSAWKQTMDEMLADLTPEQFEHVSRIMAEVVKTVKAPSASGGSSGRGKRKG